MELPEGGEVQYHLRSLQGVFCMAYYMQGTLLCVVGYEGTGQKPEGLRGKETASFLLSFLLHSHICNEIGGHNSTHVQDNTETVWNLAIAIAIVCPIAWIIAPTRIGNWHGVCLFRLRALVTR